MKPLRTSVVAAVTVLLFLLIFGGCTLSSGVPGLACSHCHPTPGSREDGGGTEALGVGPYPGPEDAEWTDAGP